MSQNILQSNHTELFNDDSTQMESLDINVANMLLTLDTGQQLCNLSCQHTQDHVTDS